MRHRQLHELNITLVKRDLKWATGALEAAALVDEMYSSVSTHKYLLGDCVLLKLNLLGKGRRARINPKRIKP